MLAELRSASKTYGKGGNAVAAVRDLDLAVRPGELLAVLGPNGAGKSTAIGLLTGPTGRLHLSEGTVRNYLSEAAHKLGAANRVAAARRAHERGWL